MEGIQESEFHLGNESQQVENVPKTFTKNEAHSKFSTLYKSSKTFMNQDERRREFLELQKRQRLQVINEKRGISDLLLSDEDDGVEEPELMDVEEVKTRRRRRKSIYSNRLMLSEWFTEIPSDLETNWFIKLCPVGHRNLVVANDGTTKAYSRSGQHKNEFQSDLPCGNPHNIRRNSFTILDCIYNLQTKIYFVLDVIAWNGVPQKYYPAEHRFFWLKSKLEEETSLREVNSINNYAFVELESFSADLSLLESKLSLPFNTNGLEIPLDGVLFYHKEGLYRNGLTPLVGWLKPYMIPEMLSLPVHESFMSKKPPTYVNLGEFLRTKTKSRVK